MRDASVDGAGVRSSSRSPATGSGSGAARAVLGGAVVHGALVGGLGRAGPGAGTGREGPGGGAGREGVVVAGRAGAREKPAGRGPGIVAPLGAGGATRGVDGLVGPSAVVVRGRRRPTLRADAQVFHPATSAMTDATPASSHSPTTTSPPVATRADTVARPAATIVEKAALPDSWTQYHGNGAPPGDGDPSRVATSEQRPGEVEVTHRRVRDQGATRSIPTTSTPAASRSRPVST